MTQTMKLRPLWEALVADGRSATEGVLRAHVAMTLADGKIAQFKDDLFSPSHPLLRTYVPVITRIEVVKYREVVLLLPPAVQCEEVVFIVPPATPLFAQVAQRLDELVEFPLSDTLVGQSAPAPDDQARFEHPLQHLAALDRIHTTFAEARSRDDEAVMADLRWERFTWSETYRAAPCTLDLYKLLLGGFHDYVNAAEDPEITFYDYYNEFQDSARRQDDYHAWFQESAQRHVTPGGIVKETSRAAAIACLERWKGSDSDDEPLCVVVDHLAVHQVHHHLFEPIIDAWMASQTPSDDASPEN